MKKLELEGQTYGKLTVLERCPDNSKNVLCSCDCGKTTVVNISNLRRGLVVSCGCYRKLRVTESCLKVLTGQRFGRVIVLCRDESVKGKGFWLCQCDCGQIATIEGAKLRAGHTKSCGCLAVDVSRARATKHGMTSRREYSVWSAMIRRCFNKNTAAYKYYGGRGITVCDEWLRFENFFSSVGIIAEGLEIDRIDNNRGYCPSNVRLVSHKENCNNRG